MNRKRLEQILSDLKRVRLIVFGDYFLDYYLMLERRLSEISVETGLEAFQVVSTRKYPGAAGTVVSNLRSLGVNVLALGLSGDDGNGFELRKKLTENNVDLRGLLEVSNYDTPTYMKPMMAETNGEVHELNRMDVKHRTQLSLDAEDGLIKKMQQLLPEADGMLVVDQVHERNCGVVTDRLRSELKNMAAKYPQKIISVDSRDYLSLFEGVMLKSNVSEVLRASGLERKPDESPCAIADRCGRVLNSRTGKPVVVTLGSEGLYLVENAHTEGCYLSSIPVSGPIDIVGAGDSVNASIGAALCAGVPLPEAGMLGNLVASIVIQQIGVTGMATPDQVLAQFDAHPDVPYFERIK
ncbi:MAG: PfkB family carbohydrate kinase [Anaerolineae bacterium]|nr:PfkB family carbohydrate kinase [Anaerolineae bacterium]